MAIRHETLRLLDLTFEEGDSGNADLQNLVNNFFAPERLDGRSSDGHKCDRCHERGGSTKAIAITRAPETLLLSLKRFSTDAGGSASKIRTVVRMPDLLTLPDAGRTSYTLSAFIAHKGETVRKGHYTAVVKDEKGGYTTCSDSWVGSDVVEDPLSTPYMYFYTRSGCGGSGDDAQWRVVAPRAEDTAWAAARDHLQDTRRGSPHQPEMPATTTTAPPSSRATCQGSSKKGNACTAKAQLGSKFCGKHAPASSKAKGPTETGSHKPKQRNRKDSGCDEEEPLFKNCIVCDVPQTLYSYKSSTFHHFWDHVQRHWSTGDIPTEEPRRTEVLQRLKDLGKYACHHCRKLVQFTDEKRHLRSPHCRRARGDPNDVDAVPGRSVKDIGPLWGHLPDLKHVATVKCTSVKTIPEVIRRRVADTYRGLISDVVAAEKDGPCAVKEWTYLCLFIKTVFDDKARGAGTSGKTVSASAADITERFDKWRKKDYQTLWCEFLQRAETNVNDEKMRKQRKAADKLRKAGGPSAIARAIAWAREGCYSKALAALLSRGSAEADTKVVEELKKLHPGRAKGAVPNVPYNWSEIPAVRLTPEKIGKALDEFTLGTACGYTAWRLEHLLQCREADTTGQFLVVLTDLCQLLAEGKVKWDIQPYLGGAALSALIKKGGGIRPVAVGEIVRRLVSKALLSEVKHMIPAVLGTQQFGVGAKGGSQRVGHLMRRLWQIRNSDPKFCVWKGDFSNAFNAGLRQKILEAVKKHIPALLPWASWLLVQESTLIFREVEIKSAEGSQQGDPLGPLLFALLIKDLTDDLGAFRVHILDEKAPQSLQDVAAMYGVTVGDIRAANGDIEMPSDDDTPLGIATVVLPLATPREAILKAGESCVGLEANYWYIDDVVLAGDLRVVERAAAFIKVRSAPLGLALNEKKCELVVFPQGGAEWIPKELVKAMEDGKAFTGPFADFPDSFPRGNERRWRSFEILGCPIGDKWFVEDHIEKKVLRKVEESLGALKQIPDAQVRYSLMRACSSFGSITHILRGVDPRLSRGPAKKLDSMIRESLADLLSGGSDMDTRAWKQASISVKKGGLGLRSSSDHAEAAFIAGCNQCAPLDGWQPDLENDEAFVEARKVFLEVSGGTHALGAQKALSARVEGAVFESLFKDATVREKARLNSVAGKDAGVCWNAVPSEVFRMAIPSALFRTLIRWWLGLSVLRTAEEGQRTPECPECGAVSDEFGYHCLTCRYAGRLGVRHNAVCTVIFFAARAAHMDPVFEAQIMRGGESFAHRRSDVMIKNLGIVKHLDVAVTHPLRKDFVKMTADRTGSAAEEYARIEKDGEYAKLCSKANTTFVACVMDCYGNWCEEGKCWKKSPRPGQHWVDRQPTSTCAD